jgi:N-acetylneuraminic acid mutarotase
MSISVPRPIRACTGCAYLLACLLVGGCGGSSGGTSNMGAGSSGGGGGNPVTYSVGGTVSGLAGTVVLELNGGDSTSVSASGSFQFSTALASGAAYQVSVLTQPANQICTVSNGSGTATANISNVAVACVTQFTIGGTVTGLTGSVTLQDNGQDTLTVTANGSFTFKSAVASGGGYSIAVLTQPAGQTCAVANGSGTATANVTNVAVSCTTTPLYTVGGAVINLTGAGITIQDNGADNLALNPGTTQFVFATALPSGAAYSVSIKSQPSGQLCDTEKAAGTIGAANVSSVVILCGLWSWEGGGQTPATSQPVFGTLGVAAAGNVPGERRDAMSWTDASGNLWLFGGSQNALDPGPVLNDLWVYSPASGLWAWMGGSQATDASGVYGTKGMASGSNMPGARSAGMTWRDANGNLWLFGGTGFDATGLQDLLGDLWKYDVTSAQWTWVNGSSNVIEPLPTAPVYGTLGVPAATNYPGARAQAANWVDSSGDLWMFGGSGCCVPNGGINEYYVLSDLWMFNPSTGLWTWEGGSQTPNAAGSYGTQGIAAATNLPPARVGAMAWVDNSGKFWLFGGGYTVFPSGSPSGTGYLLNDLWKFDPATDMWTWMNGPNTPNGSGQSGTEGVAAAGNVPSPRTIGSTGLDGSGDLLLFGGQEVSPVLGPPFVAGANDLWKYDPTTNEWTWIAGTVDDGAGVYGQEGVPAASTIPGGRYAGAYWTDSSGYLWLFGGDVPTALSSQGPPDYPCCLNDLWRYHP